MRMMNAVDEQMMIVSTKTPSDCTSPCLTGWSTVAVAAAFGALPMPASLENNPRLAPLSMAAVMPPAVPASAGSRPNAERKMSENTWGSALRLVSTMTTASRT